MANGDVVGEKCPLPKSHGRLLDAHTVWHAAEEAYGNEELFRIQLNSLIQALRNTTWVLQNEKHAISDFDAWYSLRQGRMKGDDLRTHHVAARAAIGKHAWIAESAFASQTALCYKPHVPVRGRR